MWRLREPVSPILYAVLVGISLGLPLLLWWGVGRTGWVDPTFLPAPQKVIVRLVQLWQEDTLKEDILASLSRVGAGFVLASLVSIPLGIAVGSFRAVGALVEPFSGLMRYLPASAFVPLLILWLGIGEEPKIGLIFLGTVFYTLLLVADAVRAIPIAWIRVSYTLGANPLQVLVRVVLPGVLPNILDACRINLGLAWNLVILAELVAADSGLGTRILRAQRFLETDVMFVGIVCIGVIGIFLDVGLRLVKWWTLPWARD
ncbi:ABC transporter permease [Anthocerotibacter panamensis]|uniref:ABC transporter permease n=1 Tax=Anthocerotibacter panamensis TaxID=2857077 RepID=UPI001C406266|nr:ABC transporter permease [Anthocerotibacter panamensis]